MGEFEEFLSGITFRWIQPEKVLPKYYFSISSRLEKIGISLESLNTVFIHHGGDIKQRLGKMRSIPKMSTIAVGAIINKAVAQMSDDLQFVNIGVWHGFSLFAAMIGNENKKCVGVDNFSEFGSPRSEFMRRFNRLRSDKHLFYDCDYIEYFRNTHKGGIGAYLYDGEHSYENQINGLKKAEPFFSEDCVIIVDDTNWEEPRRATLDFINGSPNQYDILLDVRTSHKCHPTFWNGIMVLKKATR